MALDLEADTDGGCGMRKPRVTDHAIVQYLDRTGRISREEIAAEILTPQVERAVRQGSWMYQASNGLTYAIDRGEVVTVYPTDGGKG